MVSDLHRNGNPVCHSEPREAGPPLSVIQTTPMNIGGGRIPQKTEHLNY